MKSFSIFKYIIVPMSVIILVLFFVKDSSLTNLIVTLAIVYIASIIIFIVVRKKENREKKELKKAQEDKKEKENRAAIEAIDLKKAKIATECEKIILSSEKNGISKEQLVYLAKNTGSYSKALPISALKDFSLLEFITISQIKRQIVWEHHLEKVLTYISYLYEINYKDEQLEVIIFLLEEMRKHIDKVNTFTGVDKFNYMVNRSSAEKIPAKLLIEK